MHPVKEEINKIFRTSLGEQCEELYSTSDGRVFIRYEEADAHRKGELDPNTNPLEDQRIFGWENEHESMSNKECFEVMQEAIELLYKAHPEFQEENTTGWDLMRRLTDVQYTFYNADKFKPRDGENDKVFSDADADNDLPF
jgi:hypothetical protein